MSSCPVLYAVLVLCVYTVSSSIFRPLQYTVYEESPTGTLIADLHRDLNVTDDVVSFQLRQSSTGGRYVSVDERLGLVTTSQLVDREQLCPDARFTPLSVCQLAVDVSLRSRQFFDVIKLNIHILDINDNTPVFPESQVCWYCIFWCLHEESQWTDQ